MPVTGSAALCSTHVRYPSSGRPALCCGWGLDGLPWLCATAYLFLSHPSYVLSFLARPFEGVSGRKSETRGLCDHFTKGIFPARERGDREESGGNGFMVVGKPIAKIRRGERSMHHVQQIWRGRQGESTRLLNLEPCLIVNRNGKVDSKGWAFIPPSGQIANKKALNGT